MKHLKLPFSTPRRLPFYLATEEWCVRFLPPDDYFFSWRVMPTVICGRNQDMTREVDMDYCRKNGIDVVRRKSGGGCVYADLDNFMFSYICPGDEITATFARYTTMIAGVLQAMGVDARANGRNDIVVNNRKIAGNAFYHLPGRCIAHGTMLYNFDPSVMQRAITPSRAKLESKAVRSVPMRVTCARAEGITLSHNEFENRFISSICDGEVLVGPDDISEIEKIEQTYYRPVFLYRKGAHEADATSMPVLTAKKRIEGVGEVEIRLTKTYDRKINSIGLTGDFFLIGDMHEYICKPLEGTPLQVPEIKKAVEAANPGAAIAGLSRENLLELLIQITEESQKENI